METLIIDDIASHLLSLTTPEARIEAVINAIAAGPQALEAVLDEAARWVGSDPETARQWLDIIASLAHQHRQPAVAARATYLLAQTHAARGEFAQALTLIESAREQYEAAGLMLDALRTSMGRIHVLKELGRYADALSVADYALQRVETESAVADTDAHVSAPLLIAALAHQNRGVCFEQMGRYDEALAAYQEAENRFRILDSQDRIGDIVNNRGVILLHLGRTAEALQAFQAAADLFDPNEDAVRRALTLVNIGYAHTQHGDDVKGLAAFEQAVGVLSAVHADADAQVAMLDMAEAYLSLNLHAEAYAAYRNVLALTEHTGMTHEQARAQWGLGIALVALGQADSAAQAFERAATLFEAAGNSPMLCNVLLQQSVLSQQQANFVQAVAQVQRVVELCAQGDWPLQLTEAHLRLVELLPPDSANALLNKTQRLVKSLDLPRLHMRLQTLLGRAAFTLGYLDQAEAHFEAAIEQIEAHRARLDRTHLRAAFAQDKHAAYSDLVQTLLARDAEARHIFTWVERAKARALLDMLAGTRVDHTHDPDAAHTKVGAEQLTLIAMLQARLSELYTKVMQGPGETSPQDFVRLQTEAIEVERQISHAQMRATARQSAGASPTHADSITTPMRPDEIQAQLPSDVTMLNYYICKDEVIAFVMTHETLQIVRHVTTPAMVQNLLEYLRMEWQHFQLNDAFVRKHLRQLEASVKKILRGLHQAVLGALKPALSSVDASHPRKLIIVPHGLLHAIPFQALFDGARYVIDDYEVSYAPSCTAYVLSQARRTPATSRAVVFGNADAQIPNVATEARAIGQLLGDGTLYLNETATLAAFHANAPGARLLHLACHGLFRTDSPMFSSLKLHDGWLKAIDVLELDLSGASVVLSACDSGRSKVLGGDELMGLVRAFLGAGAASLLVSQWLVRDESTAMLMTLWYAQIQLGLGRSAALRVAQLHTRERFSHPYYWAPFVLIGQRE